MGRPINLLDKDYIFTGDTNMKSFFSLLIALTLLAFSASPSLSVKPTDKGFNEFGYNYTARVFSGLADGTDKILDKKVWGDQTYANDHLTMKWNEAWDLCNANGYDNPEYCLGAWTNNEWNGAVPGGSGEVWHYKMIWVGSLGQDSPYWVDGGYPIWENYEVIMDQGTLDGVHYWYAHGIPAGYGASLTTQSVNIDWNLSGTVEPSPWGQYDSVGSDSSSKLSIDLSTGLMAGTMKHLLPNTTYTVYLSNTYTPMDGAYPGIYSGMTPFLFTTDESGNGSWNYTLTAGTYSMSVWINQPSPAATVLISDDFDIVIN